MGPVTITVADVVAPAAGRKQGSVVDSTGKKWKVWADKLNLYQRGVTYAVTFKQNTFNGQTFDVIDTVTPAFANPMPSGPIVAASPIQPQAIPNQPFRTEDQQKSEDIAVLAIIKEWVGRIPVGDVGALAHALRSARAAWKQSKLPTTKIETGIVHDDMDDKIEF